MTKRQYHRVLGLVLLSAIVLAAFWEFWLEDVVMVVLDPEHELESLGERLEYLISVTLFVALSLVYPLVIGLRLITQQQSLTAELRRRSEEDDLTGLYNRRKIGSLLDNELARCARYHCTFSVILMDIDHFKDVNDEFGHQAGDRLLVELGATIRRTIRTSDTAGRWGGEEFIVLCPETEIEGAEAVAEKLRRTIEDAPFDRVGSKTASFGVAGYQPGTDIEAIIRKADRALYAAKSGGRNRVEVAAQD